MSSLVVLRRNAGAASQTSEKQSTGAEPGTEPKPDFICCRGPTSNLMLLFRKLGKRNSCAMRNQLQDLNQRQHSRV